MWKGLLPLVLALWAPALPARAQETAGALIDAADLLLQRDGPSMAAVDAYRAVCQKFESSEHAARARYMAAECLWRLGDLKAADAELARVPGAAGARPILRAAAELRRGQCAFALADFTRAAQHFGAVAGGEGGYLARDAQLALAQTWVALGEWEDFKVTADRLVAAWPRYGERPELRFAYGLYHYQRGELAAARAQFQQVESERARYYTARTLAEEGQHLKAIQQFRQLLVRYPQTALAEDVRFAIAESFLRSGQRQLARSAFEDVLAAHPDSPHALAARFKLATILYHDEDYARALDSLTALLADAPAADPLREKVLMLQGLSYFQLGRESEADHAFSAILSAFPSGLTSSSALFKMIHHYALGENWNQSIGLGHMFMDRYPGDPLAGRVQLLQSLDQIELGNLEPARTLLGKLLDQSAGSDLGEKALFLLTWSYHQEGDHNRIVTNYRHFARRLLPTPNPWRAHTYYLIAESYFALGLYQDAADLYRLVLNDYPFSDAAPYALQGMTASYSQLGDDQKAALEQERYLLVISNEAGANPANALAAAGMHFNRKDHKQALALYDEFLATQPTGVECAQALYQSGECLYALQYYEDAVARWRRLIDEHPDYADLPAVLGKLADTLFGLQRYGEARAAYADLAARYPDVPAAEEALFNQANCVYNEGDYDGAATLFTAYLTAHPAGLRALDAQQAVQACFLRSGRDLLAYVEQNPDASFAAEVLWEQGSEAFRAQRYAEAAQRLEAITLRYPNAEVAPDALFYLAESRFALGDLEGARACFENFTATYPDRPLVAAALLKAGHLLFAQEKYSEAAGHFLVLADQYPDDALAPLGLFNAGLCYRQLEQWGSFLSNGEDFLKRYPAHERRLELELQMADVCLNETGDAAGALARCEALATQPGAPLVLIHYQRGEALSKLGRGEEALAAYQTAADAPGALADDHGIAALARIASLQEEAGVLAAARQAYRRIAENPHNAEWAALARERISALDQELQQAGAN
ncbi:tetratricopeptide repeat protein [bacterium]|nr:tetratricopeptide repeat protein [bacterium]